MRPVTRVRFNRQAVRRVLQRRGVTGKRLKVQVRKFQRKVQVRATRHNKKVAQFQNKQAAAAQKQANMAQKAQALAQKQVMQKKLLNRAAVTGAAYGAYRRLVKSPLSRLASLGRW